MTDERAKADEIAKRRFMAINLIRISGVVFVMAGLAIVQGAIDWPKEAGYALTIVGLFDVFVMPQVLSRKWRSNDR